MKAPTPTPDRAAPEQEHESADKPGHFEVARQTTFLTAVPRVLFRPVFSAAQAVFPATTTTAVALRSDQTRSRE